MLRCFSLLVEDWTRFTYKLLREQTGKKCKVSFLLLRLSHSDLRIKVAACNPRQNATGPQEKYKMLCKLGWERELLLGEALWAGSWRVDRHFMGRAGEEYSRQRFISWEGEAENIESIKGKNQKIIWKWVEAKSWRILNGTLRGEILFGRQQRWQCRLFRRMFFKYGNNQNCVSKHWTLRIHRINWIRGREGSQTQFR